MLIPRKRFGQHFLRDKNIIQQIVAALAPQSDQHLVEIGPGQGALTLPVLQKIKHLEAIELDRDLIPILIESASHMGELTIFSADALSFDFSLLRKDERLLRIFGNLPYNISTPLIFHLLNYVDIISDMLFMLQKEVAHRLAAKANDEDYGRLSVMIQYHCQVEILFGVPNKAFHPPPRVESSIVRLIPHASLPFVAKDYISFAEIVKHAFGQRRKTIRNSLKDIISDDIWAELDIHSDLRAENLSVKDFVALSNAVTARKSS